MDNYNKIADSIKTNGFFLEENFLTREEINPIIDGVKSLLENIDLSKTQEYEDFIVGNNRNQRELSGTLGQYNKPVVVTRGLNNFDVGFVEIFNADKLFKEIPVSKLEKFISKVSKAFGVPHPKINYSIYWSCNVEKVRGYHRDIPLGGSKFLHKFFIYLTDVPTMSYGPHSYIPQTHKVESSARFANQLVGNYDDPNEYDFTMTPKMFLGPAGTAIITTQDGLHCGIPQEKGKTRMVLACKIRK